VWSTTLACPSCGSRLVAKSTDRPKQLICVNCGRTLAQKQTPTLLGLIDRYGVGALALLLLVVMPLIVVALAPWVGQPPQRDPELIRRQPPPRDATGATASPAPDRRTAAD
jgi:DNA-directed RNA polymerase subunit RPC12/RpoP